MLNGAPTSDKPGLRWAIQIGGWLLCCVLNGSQRGTACSPMHTITVKQGMIPARLHGSGAGSHIGPATLFAQRGDNGMVELMEYAMRLGWLLQNLQSCPLRAAFQDTFSLLL